MQLLLFRGVLLLALLAPLSCRRAQSVLTKDGRVKGQIVKLAFSSTLIPKSSSFSNPNAANLSMSPWVYREQCVASRLPKCLYHARCLTSGCIDPQTSKEDLSLEAKPIYYQVLVLHRVPRSRAKASRGRTSRQTKYDFRLGTEVVSVGCTCVRPFVLPQK